MIERDFCIIGGGAGGIGFLDGLLASGVDNVLLLEGRNELLYTLTWLRYVKRSFKGDDLTGFEFREKILSRERPAEFLVTGARVFEVDPDSAQVYFLHEDKAEVCHYKYLVLAAGGVPIIYGNYLLPGYRGAGIFSAYQVGEMLVHYDFIPGRKMVVYGEDEYVEDLAILAKKCGIDTMVVSPEELRVGDIEVYKGRIRLLKGNLRLEEVILDNGESISCDSLAVAGRFIPERWWREKGLIEWDLKNWEGRSTYENILLAGDMKKPSFDFVQQYISAYEAGRNMR